MAEAERRNHDGGTDGFESADRTADQGNCWKNEWAKQTSMGADYKYQLADPSVVCILVELTEGKKWLQAL